MPSEPEAPRTMLRLAPDGPLAGVVTVTALPGGHGRCRLEAVWSVGGDRHSDHVDFDTFEDARIVADEVAGELHAGHEPDLTRD